MHVLNPISHNCTCRSRAIRSRTVKMVGRQSLISKMDQAQIPTGVNVQTDILDIFVKLVGIYIYIYKICLNQYVLSGADSHKIVKLSYTIVVCYPFGMSVSTESLNNYVIF